MSSPDRLWRPVAAPALAAGVALLALTAWTLSPYGRYLHHDFQPASVGGQGLALAVFVAGWVLMCTAMMLPTSLRLLERFGTVVRWHPERGRLLALVVSGYLASWAVVGYAFRVFDTGVHGLADSVAWIGDRPQLIAGSALLVAGLFQFSAFKHRCLDRCRTPEHFVRRHWSGRRPAAAAWRIGLEYGMSCVGCCWALMLVVFGLGSVHPVWMLGFSGVVALEKFGAPPGFSHGVGGALIGAGTLVVLADYTHLAVGL